MLISDVLKVVYVAPPNTGSSTLVSAVRELSTTSIRWVGNKHDVRVLDGLDDYFWFMSVRNPYARVVSSWSKVSWPSFSRKHGWRYDVESPADMSFPGFTMHRPRLTDVLGVMGQACGHLLSDFAAAVPRLDAVVRCESLDDDFRQLPFVPDGFEPVRRNIGRYRKKQPWYKYYTPEAAARVREAFLPDFAAFNYPDDFVESVLQELDGIRNR